MFCKILNLDHCRFLGVLPWWGDVGSDAGLQQSSAVRPPLGLPGVSTNRCV
jgi:hypothetical protein